MKSILRSSVLAFATAGFLGATALHAQEATTRESSRDQQAAQAASDGWWGESQKTRDQRIAWWRDARFGCFIHWGVYADPAGEFEGKRSGVYSEHIMRSLKIPLATYKEKIVKNFDPEQFNADEWADLIQQAGMRYVIITSKHHDGFAMWPSDAYPYDIRQTKFKRDPMKELSEACRKRGIKFGFYYSHAFDWEHPDAAGNDWDYQNPGGDKKLFGGERWFDEHPELVAKVHKYVDEKAIPQVQELIAKYHPDIFWFDTPGKMPFSEQIRVMEAARKADPNVVINGRCARLGSKNWGDYVNTADRPDEVRPTPGDWESIPTVNNSYGYNKWDTKFHTPEEFITLIAKAGAKGGNTLLNIGPMGNGVIDPDSQRILKGIGAWMQTNGDSIHGTTRTPLDRQVWGDTTLKGDTLYLHVFHWPKDGKLVIGGLLSAPGTAQLLADKNQTLKVSRLNENDVQVELPSTAPDAVDSVIVLKLAEPIKAKPGILLQTDQPTNRLITFDAEAKGKPKYGDGKTGRYYVENFSSPEDGLTWKVRLNAPATFEPTFKYSSDEGQPATFKLTTSAGTQEMKLTPGKAIEGIRDITGSPIQLPAGESEIRISPADANGGAIQCFELNLKPM